MILTLKNVPMEASLPKFSQFRDVEEAISRCGLRTAPGFLRRLIASLASKPFVILTGTSGTGNTKVAQALAGWLTSDQQTYQLIPVGADWTGSDNIVGYPDGLDATAYIGKPALELVWHAAENPAMPHFLILDEMNLSHVERYFADLLSAMESREPIPLYSGPPRKLSNKGLPTALPVAPNVFVIGTVNVDETTYMFSPKVLDRANVLEFRVDAGDLQSYFGGGKTPDLSSIKGHGGALGATLVRAVTQPVETPAEVRARFESEMLLFFNVLKPHGAEFWYRVVFEASRFLYFFHELADEAEQWFEKAFDGVIAQKFLPKLHGQRTRMAPLLRKLWFLCVNPEEARGANVLTRLDEVSRSMERSAEPVGNLPTAAPYPVSAEKITRMWRLLNENGFASFAEA
jgi:5-methylcytosine-specific restriction protein B